MKLIPAFLIGFIVLFFVACNTSKKTTATTTATTTTTTTTSTPGPVPISTSGVYAPGNEELVAIQTKYKDVTLQTLTNGYGIYTGACTSCHGAQGIYERSEEEWTVVLDDMAPRAGLTPEQKDAVFKYILSIKATQPK
jgi:predicted ThiF/HesA family dinucleotide-utilizing enzyme